MKCNINANRVVYPTYEYEEGVPLKDVEAFECPNCGEFTFTEEQVDEMERRTDAIKIHTFSFLRRVTVSGRSLCINIPEDLARHLKVAKGQAIRIRALDDRRFLVEKQIR
ncbi:TPA: hypothetical protein HA244_00825 [Candidatus Micrarchaeota archaeon]|nr:hypothetical protein [Candidatus Micrarchaeota archaeon]